MKKLKIQFWKAEKALAMQILEQEGLPKEKGDGFIKIIDSPALDFKMGIWLRGYHSDAALNIETISLNSNAERDAYLQKAVNAITGELFAEGELKIGEMCEMLDYEDKQWKKRKLLAILPEQYNRRFIAETEGCPDEYSSWDYARSITKRTEPTIEECGQLITYTWEKK